MTQKRSSLLLKDDIGVQNESVPGVFHCLAVWLTEPHLEGKPTVTAGTLPNICSEGFPIDADQPLTTSVALILELEFPFRRCLSGRIGQ